MSKDSSTCSGLSEKLMRNQFTRLAWGYPYAATAALEGTANLCLTYSNIYNQRWQPLVGCLPSP